MLLIDPAHLAAANAATTAAELQALLQQGLRLEQATIAPYLTAAYSLQQARNGKIRAAILGVVRDEMLHMTVVANVLNAIGGRPVFTDPALAPVYPGPLPMGVGGDLIVGLQRFSPELNAQVMMAIEEPESDPPVFPGAAVAAPPEFATIGAFYRALMDKIGELGDAIFTGHPDRQVVDVPGFPPERLRITGAKDAVQALAQLVREGEGTATTPVDDEEDIAHYFTFQEIDRGRELVIDPGVPEGYSFTGDPVPFDPAGVFDMPDNPRADHYPPGSEARRLVDDFNQAYAQMLGVLQEAFDGAPDRIGDALMAMTVLRRLASQLFDTTDPTTGKRLAPTFEFTPQ